MTINSAQLQKGLSLAAFLKDFGTKEQCEAAFIKTRWPATLICSCCSHMAVPEFRRQERCHCKCGACRHQTILRAGTRMGRGQLPLTK